MLLLVTSCYTHMPSCLQCRYKAATARCTDLVRCTAAAIYSSLVERSCCSGMSGVARTYTIINGRFLVGCRDKVAIDGRPHEVDGVFDARLDKEHDIFHEVTLT